MTLILSCFSNNMNSKRISKNDISGPSPIRTTPLMKRSVDSGIDVRNNSIDSNIRNSFQLSSPELKKPISAGIVPFAVGRHDVSVSVVGGPADPRRYESDELKTLSLMKYQTFVQALSAYKRQIQAMSAATETFVRELQDFADCVPAAEITDSLLVTDLDFLIDSSQLIANAHQTWANTLENEVEEPLMASVQQIPIITKAKQDTNKVKIQELIRQIHIEEEAAQKLRKKKTTTKEQMDMSFNLRVELAEEVKLLTHINHTYSDTLSQESVPYILELLSKSVEAELDCIETISEGFHKVLCSNLTC
ncbi:hypothetical protein BC833DRAFT_587437 [Globomyces pollinis-pini]|nr:hypothetical protein BC833DRAFT_587437 [Globomyces pollinis-pini]